MSEYYGGLPNIPITSVKDFDKETISEKWIAITRNENKTIGSESDINFEYYETLEYLLNEYYEIFSGEIIKSFMHSILDYFNALDYDDFEIEYIDFELLINVLRYPWKGTADDIYLSHMYMCDKSIISILNDETTESIDLIHNIKIDDSIGFTFKPFDYRSKNYYDLVSQKSIDDRRRYTYGCIDNEVFLY